MSPLMQWQPDYKVQVVLVDNTDLANGFTAPIGRIGMVLMVTPPESFFSTAYYDDWLRLLVFHEYTHFLNIDATTGFYSILRILFGDVLLPNAVLPDWMLEGLAVYMETRYTALGRGRSPYYEMILRAAVDENVLDHPSFMTLDRIQGTDPWPPGGEVPYLFGYEMTNQAASNKPENLGELSIRSAGRVPYFINGNVENVTGKSWYTHWNDWVEATRKRMSADLARIKSQPVTEATSLTPASHSELGVAVSPDGKWLAHTDDTPDQRSGLVLRELATGHEHRVIDKILGGSLAFSPDSKRLYFSAIRRLDQYHLLSDLAVYDLESGKRTWLTDGKRARDPDISPDGKSLVFTITENQTTGLATAPLTAEGLGAIRKLHFPPRYGRVDSPKFTRDGKRVIFGSHENGKGQEDLLEQELSSGQVRRLVADGHFNRFPALTPEGDIAYVSDATGVDNLYRYREGKAPELLTNVTSGVAFPAFGPGGPGRGGKLYAEYWRSSGWTVAELKPLAGAPAGDAVKVAPPPAPTEVPPSPGDGKDYDVKDYSVWPSILPREWYFLPTFYPDSVYFNAQVAGFDAVDRHRYLGVLGYDTGVPAVDWLVGYENRQLGPTLSFYLSNSTTGSYRYTTSSGNSQLLYYDRKFEFNFLIYDTYLWTYSAITPFLGFNSERTRRYVPGYSPENDDLYASSRFVPSIDAYAIYSDAERSRLAIATERGRSTLLGVRQYLDPTSAVTKGLFSDTEHFTPFDHTVIAPRLVGSAVSHLNDAYSPSNVVLQGRYNRLISPIPGEGFKEIGIRGYPNQTFYARQALLGSVDVDFPVFRVFRGWGTNPLFLDQFHGFVFGESSYLPFHENGSLFLPSAGAGLKVDLDVLVRVPLEISVEYHKGFEESLGGKGETFVQLGLGALGF